jgi:hypothetical protein
VYVCTVHRFVNDISFAAVLFCFFFLFRCVAAGVCQYLSSSTAVRTELSSSKQIDLAIVYEQGHRSDNRRTAQFFQVGLV